MTKTLGKLRFGIVIGLLLVVMLRVTVDWRLLGRSLTYPDRPITAADWYQPRQIVPGIGPQAPPLARAETTDISPAALQTALEFAAAQNSVALLVMHRDRLVLEQ